MAAAQLEQSEELVSCMAVLKRRPCIFAASPYFSLQGPDRLGHRLTFNFLTQGPTFLFLVVLFLCIYETIHPKLS